MRGAEAEEEAAAAEEAGEGGEEQAQEQRRQVESSERENDQLIGARGRRRGGVRAGGREGDVGERVVRDGGRVEAAALRDPG